MRVGSYEYLSTSTYPNTQLNASYCQRKRVGDSEYLLLVLVLDMEVKIIDRNITTKVFCKADIFPFHVISLPFLASNLDTKICYKVFYGQIVRFQRLCSFIIDFEERTKFLLDILLNRGYKSFLLKREFCKAVEKYIGEFQKWVLPSNFQNWFDQISNSNFGFSTQDILLSSQTQVI